VSIVFGHGRQYKFTDTKYRQTLVIILIIRYVTSVYNDSADCRVRNMGCDINVFLEYKGLAASDWYPFGYGYCLPRNYVMFAKMAGVRGEACDVIFEQKDCPNVYPIMSKRNMIKEKIIKDAVITRHG